MKLLLIGAGYWGEKLLERFIKLDQEVVVAESNDERRRYIEEKYGVQTSLHYASWNIDACVVATLPSDHFQLVQNCLKAQKHVLVEKPMALKSEEARALVELSLKNNLTLMTDLTFLCANMYQRLEKTIRDATVPTWMELQWDNPREETPEEGILRLRKRESCGCRDLIPSR